MVALITYHFGGKDYSNTYQLCLLRGEELSVPSRGGGNLTAEVTLRRPMVRSLVSAVHEGESLSQGSPLEM